MGKTESVKLISDEEPENPNDFLKSNVIYQNVHNTGKTVGHNKNTGNNSGPLF